MIIKPKFDSTKFFLAVLISFIAIQIGSYVLSELGFMPFIKIGWGLMLILTGVMISTLFILGQNINQLSMKKDGPFIGLIFITIILMFIFLPKYLPEIFSSYSIGISDTIREVTGSIVASIGQGIGVSSNGGLS